MSFYVSTQLKQVHVGPLAHMGPHIQSLEPGPIWALIGLWTNYWMTAEAAASFLNDSFAC